MKPAKIISLILLTVSILLSLVYLYWHWKLGLTRYFDVDEYAHLHWATQMLLGKKPYVDFLTFFPPGFAWFLTPALFLGWGTIQPFITARVMTFFVFVGMGLTSALIFHKLRRSLWGAIMVVAILSFLPMPFDKYLEVRPDNLATLLILIAVYTQICWMWVLPLGSPISTHKGTPAMGLPASSHPLKIVKWWPMISGAAYGLSYLVLPKMLPNIAIGFIIAFIYVTQNLKLKIAKDRLEMLVLARPFLLGFGAPLFLFAIWALTLGHLDTIIYSLTSLTLESNRISKYFIMVPFLFFYPNATFYGQDGWSRGLITNHVIWELGLFFALYRLITPYLSPSGNKRFLAEILVALSAVVQVIFYISVVPLKHTQYLIPIGVFVAWYMADLLLAIYNQLGKVRFGQIVFTGIFVIGSIYSYQIFMEVNSVKQLWTNTKPLTDIAAIYKRIPLSEPVLDLDGRMLYNPDPYYACCIPFGQFAEFLSRPLPDLPKALENRNVKYINQGELQRVNTLPWAWQQYIYANYHSDSGNNALLIRNDVFN
jgi:hypothetical protein